MCKNTCNECNKCEDICCCPKPKYINTVCDDATDFKCVVLEKNADGTKRVFPCLNFQSGESLLDLVKKVEILKCELANQNFYDEKVKTNASDSTGGFLADKIIAGDCITWTTENVSGNIKLKPQLDFLCIFNKIKALTSFCPEINQCVNTYVPCSKPASVTLSGITITNTCPNTVVNLNSLVASVPSGTTLEFHRNSSHTNLITNSSAYSITDSASIYAFTKDNTTGCYSNGTLINLNITQCLNLPVLNLTCPGNVTVASGTFVKDYSSIGSINLPVTVVSGSGSISVIVTGNGFSNNGSFTQTVTTATTSLIIPISYNGSGNVGNHVVTITINNSNGSVTTCSYNINVICEPCILNANSVTFTNITSTGFDVNVASLVNTASCTDTYDIVITNTITNTVVQTASNQINQPYSFTAGFAGTTYSVDVTKKSCCGNTSSTVTKTVVTSTCITTTIVGTPVLPDAVSNTPYYFVIHLAGTQPFAIRPTINRKPSWMTESLVGDTITLGGVPTAPGKFDVNLAYDNCNNVNPAQLQQTLINIT